MGVSISLMLRAALFWQCKEACIPLPAGQAVGEGDGGDLEALLGPVQRHLVGAPAVGIEANGRWVAALGISVGGG